MSVSKVLIIDDSPLYADLLIKGFNKFNIEARAIDDSFDVIEEASKFNPDFIILDIMMPNKSGFELCELLKTNPNTIRIPIIFVSANEDADSVIKSIHVGCIDYIKKPVNIESLVKTLISHDFQTPIKESLSYMRQCVSEFREKYNVNS